VFWRPGFLEPGRLFAIIGSTVTASHLALSFPTSMARFTALVLLLGLLACRPSAPAPEPASKGSPVIPSTPYRLTDHFDSANVTLASSAPTSMPTAQPRIWRFADEKVTWQSLRGRMGFKKPGLLVVKGDGNTPVIAAPTSPAIDWAQYEAVKIRMISEGGTEIKVRLGAQEFKQKLAPAMEWKVYQFDIPAVPSGFVRPLAIMPTDDLSAAVAIDFIELVPRKETLSAPAGVTNIAKLDEYRNTLFSRTPASMAFDIPIPAAGPVLHFGLGMSGKAPVTFRVLGGPAKAELFQRQVSNPDQWEDAEVDLSPYAGTTAHIVLESASSAPAAVGFWANPLVISRTLPRRPNVLLYVVCTLRPDHTSLYGYTRETTPFLKKLGASAVVFDDAVAQASWTKASVPSILTSLEAYTHGLVNESDTIPRGAVTMAEQLRAAGYVTASIVANPFAGRASGLERGFDYVLEYPVVQRQRTDAVDRGTDSAAINRAILPWLERHRDEPLFLFVLSTDPHAPYRPPAEFEKQFANPAETEQFNRDYAKLRDIRAYGGGATVSRAEIRAKGIDDHAFVKRAMDRYDGEIAHNDRSIEAFTGKLKDLGLLDNTLVVFASDHGEEFWEHGLGAHGHSLYSELIHVALMLWNPKLIPQGRRVADTVQLIDILPTVMDLLGLKKAGGLEGRSLAPLLAGGHLDAVPAMSTKLALPSAKPGGAVPENLTDTVARVEPEWKLIYRLQAQRAHLKPIELYDRRTDRTDRNDVAVQHPDVANRMKADVLKWIEEEKTVKARIGQSGSKPLDDATLQRLRGLGYIGGKSEKDH
jgi:arylsulfatase A-like enzyme